MDLDLNLKKYRSHKIVGASPILFVGVALPHTQGDRELTYKDSAGHSQRQVFPASMFSRYIPHQHDYLVQYEGDGYLAISPKKAFEEGYSEILPPEESYARGLQRGPLTEGSPYGLQPDQQPDYARHPLVTPPGLEIDPEREALARRYVGPQRPMMTDAELEAALAALPGERVTKEFMESQITDVRYLSPDHASTVTICNITLRNGYSVRGESACVDPANYNAAIGERIAYDDALKKLWPLFGFLLAEGRYRRGTDA